LKFISLGRVAIILLMFLLSYIFKTRCLNLFSLFILFNFLFSLFIFLIHNVLLNNRESLVLFFLLVYRYYYLLSKHLHFSCLQRLKHQHLMTAIHFINWINQGIMKRFLHLLLFITFLFYNLQLLFFFLLKEPMLKL